MSRIRSRALLVIGLSSWLLTGLAIGDTTFATTTPPDEASVTAPPPETSSSDDLDALLVDVLGEQDGGIAVLSIRDGVTTSAVAGDRQRGRRSNRCGHTVPRRQHLQAVRRHDRHATRR